MDPVEALKLEGWSLSESGWQKVTENGSLTNKKQIEKNALDIDIRELGGCSFPSELTKGKLDLLSGTFVVQVQKVRNISAPKANEDSKAAPRLLRLTLTDGAQTVQALEMTTLNSVSMLTVPGTKLRLSGEMRISHGLLLLNGSNVATLGGHVANLADKWTLNRSLAKQMRGRYSTEGGPPPWIPFGQKIAPMNLTDVKKSVDDGSGKENAKDDEFEAQRRDAIAEAGRAGTAKKVFGGGGAGSRQLVDRNVQSVMEHGFTQQQAEAALKQAKNNVKKAIKNLKRRTGAKGIGEGKEKGDKEGIGGGGKGGRRKGGGGDDDGGGGGQPKPSGKVCLFQFLEDKLPAAAVNPVSNVVDKERETEKEWGDQHNHPKGALEKGKPPSNYPSTSGRNPTNLSNHNNNNTGVSHSSGGGGYSGMGRGEGSPSQARNRDNRRHNTNQSNRKAPRFQNQNRQYQQNQQPPQNYNSNSGSSYGGGSSIYQPLTNQYATDHQSNQQLMNAGRPQQPLLPGPQNHNTTTLPNNQFSGSNNSGGGAVPNAISKQRTLYYKQHGMPDIPEFPYKDNNAFIPPLMSSTIGYFQDGHVSGGSGNKSGVKPNSAMGGGGNAAGNLPGGHTGVTAVSNPLNTHTGLATPTMVPNPAHRGNDGDMELWWDVGDRCMAKYWEDSLYYNAEITGLSKKTCVVKFLNYGNYEEVLHEDCIPITAEDGSCIVPVDCGMMAVVPMHNNTGASNRNNNSHFTGAREFRRGGTRPHMQQQQQHEGGGGGGGRQRSGPQRYTQPVYLPPASRARTETTVHHK